MATLEQLAKAVLNRDLLDARALAQDILRSGRLSSMPAPDPGCGESVAIMAAALAELLADYAHLPPPAWTSRWGRMPEDIDLLPAAGTHLRRVLTNEAPEPLKRRNILAPNALYNPALSSPA